MTVWQQDDLRDQEHRGEERGERGRAGPGGLPLERFLLVHEVGLAGGSECAGHARGG